MEVHLNHTHLCTSQHPLMRQRFGASLQPSHSKEIRRRCCRLQNENKVFVSSKARHDSRPLLLTVQSTGKLFCTRISSGAFLKGGLNPELQGPNPHGRREGSGLWDEVSLAVVNGLNDVDHVVDGVHDLAREE